jgi:hypothetical protein
MTAWLARYHGSTDALRFGLAIFDDGTRKHFRWDRLSDRVAFIVGEAWEEITLPPERVSEVLALLHAREPLPRAAA